MLVGVLIAAALTPGLTFDKKLEFSKHGNGVTAIAWSISGDAALISGTDRRLRVIEDGSEARNVEVPSIPTALVYSPDGKSVAVGFEDRRVRVYKWPELSESYAFETPAAVTSLAYSPAGKEIGIGMDGTGDICIFDIGRRLIKAKMLDLNRGTAKLLWKTSGSILAAGHGVKSWSVSLRKYDRFLEIPWALSICALPAGDYVFIGNIRQANGRTPTALAIWRSGRSRPELLANSRGSFLALAPTTDSLYFGTAVDGRIDVYSASSLEVMATTPLEDDITAMAFSAKDDKLILGSRSGKVYLYSFSRL